MDQLEEELLVLRLTVEHLFSQATWPTLAELHRPIHRGLGKTMDVGEVARRVAPHPFISGYDDLGDTFAPPLVALARVPESYPLLDRVLRVVKYAHDKYMSSSDDAEVLITEVEARDAVGLNPEHAAVVRLVLDGVPWITNGGGSGEDGWYFRVSDHITRWEGVQSRDGLIQSLEAIAEHQRKEYAAMASAKADIIRGTQTVGTLVVETPAGLSHWYEQPWAKGLAWALGIALTALSLFVGLRQL